MRIEDGGGAPCAGSGRRRGSGGEGGAGRGARGLTRGAPGAVAPRPGFRSLRIRARTATWAAACEVNEGAASLALGFTWEGASGSVTGALVKEQWSGPAAPPPRPTHEDDVAPPGLAPLPGPPGGGGWCRGSEFCLGGSWAPPGASVGSGDQTPGSGVRRCWRLVAPHIGRQTTHRARARGRGYSEAGVRGSTQASPRAAGPPARGLGGCPPDPSPSGGGRGLCAPRSSARAEGRSEGAGVGAGALRRGGLGARGTGVASRSTL